MRRLLNAVMLAGAIVGLGGCAYHTFAPGPGMSPASYESEAAQCRLFARGNDPSFAFETSGSPKFVAASMAGAAVGAAIGTAVRENANFNDCMMARGWRIADNAQPVTAATVAVQTAAPAPAPPPNVQSVTATTVAVQTAAIPAPAPPPAARRNLGIRSSNVTDSLAYSSQLDPPRGVIVMSVMQEGAAAAAGLLAGDVILSFGATPLMTVADLQRALAVTPANSVVPVRIWRDRQELAINLQF